MAVYNRVPVFAQNILCNLEGIRINKSRYSKQFYSELAFYEEHDKWDYGQKCEVRDKRLSDICKYSYEHTKYYKKEFDECGLNPYTIKRLDDISCLPIIDKQTVINNYEDFISDAYPRNKMITAHTSGTTGAGFVFLTTKEAQSSQWAVWWRYRRKLGIGMDEWCALFGGRSVVPLTITKPPYSRMNTPNRQEYFSTYHMNNKTLGWYVDEISQKHYRWLHGYPSMLSVLADYVIENSLQEKFSIKFVTTGAENLLDSQKEKIFRAFRVEPRTHYGMAEGVANFSENSSGDMYVDEEYAAAEFINGEVVGTNLTNFAMPLIRYRTKDLAMVSETKVGRKIISLDGRQEDFVTLKDGTKIGRLDHIFKDLVNIREAQIYQPDYKSIEVRVVKGSLYSKADEQRLKKEINDRIRDMDIHIRYCEQIPKTQSGKLRFVISDI